MVEKKQAATKTTAAKAAPKAAASKAAPAKEGAKAPAAKTTAKTTASKETKATAEKKPAAKTTTKTAAAKSSAAKPAAAKSVAAKATSTKPAAKATATKTAAAKTAATKAAATKTTAAKTAATKTAATKTAAAKTTAKASATKAAAKPAAAKATAAKPAASKAAKATKAAAKPAAEKATPEERVAAAKPAKATAAAKAKTMKATKPATAKPAKAEPAKEPAVELAKEPAVEPEKATAAKPAAEPKPEPKPAPEPAPEPAKAYLAAEIAKDIAEEAAGDASEFAGVGGVLIAAAECAPLVKVGGLADVVGALPKYLKKLGVDARIIMPFHRQIKERFGAETKHMCDFQASLGWRSQYVGLEKLEIDGTVYYFIDNEFYFGGPIYCGGEFEGEQYAFFTRAVVDAIPQLDFDVRILHCNDWHTAMMPLLVKTQYEGGMQRGLRTLLTIHNLHFQGKFSHEFDRDLLRVDDSLATPEFIAHYECDNMLKAGIVFADKVNTVSPTYAREICEPYLGETLDGVLRSRGADLSGILNGIDVEEWNPQTDKNLPANFALGNLGGKTECRDSLLQELGLEPAGENTAVIGLVSRLVPQKGIDLVNAVIDELVEEDVRVIVLGSGYGEYEGFLRDAENRHKGRLCSYIGYNGELSHRIYAGSDLFLMPSLFEPCGISQLIALRYGTLPIVRETGGLRDTVIPYNEFTGEGNGFSFANYDAGEMLGVIRYALWTWRGEEARGNLVKNAMESDFSMDRTAREYAELYRSLL